MKSSGLTQAIAIILLTRNGEQRSDFRCLERMPGCRRHGQLQAHTWSNGKYEASTFQEEVFLDETPAWIDPRQEQGDQV